MQFISRSNFIDVILHGTLAPELFAATTALSRLTTIVKGIANHAVDRSRGNAMQRMLNMGWSERTMFYPNPKTQSTERPPVEFLHSDIIHIEPRTISENKELWEVLLSSELVSQEGPIYLRAASFFEDILDSFSEDMPELWWERLADDLVFFRARFDDISSFEKAGDVLTSTEKLTGVSDPTKREEIKQNIADAKASMVARSLEILSVIRQKVQAQEAHNRALQLEQANQERVAIYDKVGLWADIESYPEEHRRDIQTLLNGAIALKDDFIDRYGVEKGLEAVASLDAYTREATELLSRGASFAHIYQGMLNKFGEHETESGADGGNEMVVALPDLEDFQRLYAPEVPQVPLSVFGDRYPGAFYDIAVSGSAQPAECYNSDDLR